MAPLAAIGWTRGSAAALSIVLVASLAAFALRTAAGVWQGYSYWFDELFSVTLASLPPAEQVPVLLSDVHPPLYQMLLSLWIAVFGTSEVATRFLSFALVGLGLGAWPVLARAVAPDVARLFLIVLLGNWLVWFYAQETRSYGLVLALSLWLLALLAAGERRWVFPVAVLLGLTHFFGTLTAGLALLWLLAERLRDGRRWLACGLALGVLALWPLAMVLFGTGRELLGGQFWIRASPADALAQALMAAHPVLQAALGMTGAGLAAVALGLGGLAVAALVLARVGGRDGRAVALAGVLFFGVTGMVFLVSLHTPVATLRNFITVVPAASLLIAAVLAAALRRPGWRIVGAGLVALVALGGQVQVAEAIGRKTTPQHDWRETAARTEAHLDAAGAPQLLLHAGFDLGGPAFMLRLQSHYLSGRYSAALLDDTALDRLEPGTVIHFGHVGPLGTDLDRCENSLTLRLRERGLAFDAWFTPQSLPCLNGYLVIRRQQGRAGRRSRLSLPRGCARQPRNHARSHAHHPARRPARL